MIQIQALAISIWIDSIFNARSTFESVDTMLICVSTDGEYWYNLGQLRKKWRLENMCVCVCVKIGQFLPCRQCSGLDFITS